MPCCPGPSARDSLLKAATLQRCSIAERERFARGGRHPLVPPGRQLDPAAPRRSRSARRSLDRSRTWLQRLHCPKRRSCRASPAMLRGSRHPQRDWAEEVRHDLVFQVYILKQGGLWRKQAPVDTRTLWRAHIVLRAGGVTHEEQLAALRHLKFVGHPWRCRVLGVSRLRQRDRDRRGEGRDGRYLSDASSCPLFPCDRILHAVDSLSRVSRR
jgi:hypothetical protein